jgi:hypothetical protein
MLKPSTIELLLDPNRFRAFSLASTLSLAASALQQRSVSESLMQELWSLARQITPFTLPGPLPERDELRTQLDEIDRRLGELLDQAGISRNACEISLSPKACALWAESERLQELATARERVAPGGATNWEARLALLEERARLRIQLIEDTKAEELDDFFDIDYAGKKREG